MKKPILLFTLFISMLSFAQIEFEKGYYINNDNIKTECLIKNIDWLNNPKDFTYKTGENTDSKILTIKDVIEFGIYNKSKYIRQKVDIDKSSERTNAISTKRNSEFINEQLFLKTLIEGEASLYKYIEKSLTRYFYSRNNSEIKQLVFKSYLNNNNKIAENNFYRQQLSNDLKCESINSNTFKNIEYTQKDLIKLFKGYNNCKNTEFKNFETKTKKDLINLNIRPGINLSSFEFNTFRNNKNLSTSIHYRLGLEAEFVFNFNNNKWAAFVEPTYVEYQATNNLESLDRLNVDYSSIEIPVGIRHYFFLNNDSKLYVNAAFIFDINLENIVNDRLEGRSENNFIVGAGFKYKDYSVELRQHTNKELLTNFASISGVYSNLSIIFGYSIF